MPYSQDLDPIIQGVLNEPDVRSAIDSPTSPLNDAILMERIKERSALVWQALSTQLVTYDEAEKSLSDARLSRNRALRRPAWLDNAGNTYLYGLSFLILAAIVYGVAALLRAHWPGDSLRWLGAQRWIWWAFAAFAAVSAVILGRLLIWERVQRPRIARRVDVQADVDGRRKLLDALKQTLDGQVRTEVQRLVTELINEGNQTFYQDRLYPTGQVAGLPYGVRETAGRGLSETVTPAYEINTPAQAGLIQTLETLPGANIGIAGPRGAGKSTLLGSLCQKNPRIGTREALGVYTSAPVDYEARDFILHLYASLCRKVLETKKVAEDKGSPFGDDPREGRSRRRVGQVVAIFGVALIAFSIVIALVNSSTDGDAAAKKAEAGLISSTAAQTAAATAAALAPGTAKPPPPPAKAAAPAKPEAPPTPGQVLKAFDVKPGDILLWGLVLAGAGFAVFRSDRWLHEDGPVVPLLIGPSTPEPKPSQPEDALVAKCQLALKEIRFQRSYSSGWSGELHLPAGVNFSRNQAVSMAQIQQSQPELVQAFRDLLAEVAAEYGKVVIGIDELDKLRSDEDAQRFLNEIKSVFGVQGVFFLVSVSESAISNFERRGLPFRDAFDSAFDFIRFIDYLSLDDTRRLLARRVINLPDPFLGLAHVMAGGLPREVIRFARALLGQARLNGAANSVGDIARALAVAEVDSKRRAMTFLARDAAVEPETTDFMQRLAALEAFDPLAPTVVNQLRLKPTLAAPGAGDDEAAAARAKLDKLWRELDCFLYFVATTAELFAGAVTQPGWDALVANGSIGRLAKARQSLELGTGVAAFELTALRQLNGLAVPPP